LALASLLTLQSETSGSSSEKAPLSPDVILRIISGFVLIVSQILCIYAAVIFVITALFNLSSAATMMGATILGIPTMQLLLSAFRMVVSAERDPENQ
jgi:hypothetical protein